MNHDLLKFYKEIENMALDEGDKAIMHDIARCIIKEVMSEHIKTCPHGQAMLRTKILLVGICIGSGIASGGLVLGVTKLVFGG